MAWRVNDVNADTHTVRQAKEQTNVDCFQVHETISSLPWRWLDTQSADNDLKIVQSLEITKAN